MEITVTWCWQIRKRSYKSNNWTTLGNSEQHMENQLITNIENKGHAKKKNL